jgi:two-component system OmpR family sensor kinase
VSLRARILLATLALASAGLVVADFAIYRFMSSFLVERVDQQLRAASIPVTAALVAGVSGDQSVPTDAPLSRERQAFMPAGTYAGVLDEEGQVNQQVTFTFDERAPPPPRLPSGLPGSGETGRSEVMLTTPATSGGTEYRLLAMAIESGTLVIAIPLTEVAATQQRLLLVEGVVTALAILAIALVGLWLVRFGLRPLERMADTAGAIAAGDLSRRVEPDDPRTEVGRLGGALNVMLAQIEQGFKERTESEERLRRFLADASHELRTPVTSIRGYAELFRRGAAERPDDLALVMRRIEEEGGRMGELVDDMLLLARLDQGLPLEREPVDLTEIASAAVEAARAAEPERPISLHREHPVVVVGAATRLRRVIDNLLSNVRDHTPAQTAVHVSVTSAGTEAVLEVADEGPGIPEAEAVRIFERFYRTDRSRSRSHGNLGLGLAIIASVVAAHHGQVRYAAREGGGSVFRVVLPLGDRQTLADQDGRLARS